MSFSKHPHFPLLREPLPLSVSMLYLSHKPALLPLFFFSSLPGKALTLLFISLLFSPSTSSTFSLYSPSLSSMETDKILLPDNKHPFIIRPISPIPTTEVDTSLFKTLTLGKFNNLCLNRICLCVCVCVCFHIFFKFAMEESLCVVFHKGLEVSNHWLYFIKVRTSPLTRETQKKSKAL